MYNHLILMLNKLPFHHCSLPFDNICILMFSHLSTLAWYCCYMSS